MNLSIWSNMFTLSVPVLEKILRPIFVYAFLIIGLRLAGKRELAQLNPLDLIVLLTLSNTVQNAIIGNDNSVTGGLIGAATLLFLNYLVVRFVYKNKKAEVFIEGTEDVLIDHGQLQDKAMERDSISRTDLEIAAHRQGLATLEEVERAVLEPDGVLSFIAKKPDPEVSRHMELLTRLEDLSKEVESLRRELAARGSESGSGSGQAG
jgi:uncharacterized membrane protein YcaP (DUF421 family)